MGKLSANIVQAQNDAGVKERARKCGARKKGREEGRKRGQILWGGQGRPPQWSLSSGNGDHRTCRLALETRRTCDCKPWLALRWCGGEAGVASGCIRTPCTDTCPNSQSHTHTHTTFHLHSRLHSQSYMNIYPNTSRTRSSDQCSFHNLEYRRSGSKPGVQLISVSICTLRGDPRCCPVKSPRGPGLPHGLKSFLTRMNV